ncbi:MAG: hypothetical protein J6W61_06100 [Bacteroidales bacterium]|nr:hypothetical protein [Bacteroidales bacterium]
MPYRRLPNTDAAIIKAMKTALERGKEIPPYELAYSAKNMVRIQRFLPLFEHNIQLQRQSQKSQTKKDKDYYEIQHKARIYMTHFIRVMNMAIARGELPKEIRSYYGLDINDSTVPLFNTDAELIKIGQQVINGEEERLRRGGSPITNPTIAVVKVWFEKYLDIYRFHQTISKRTMDYSEKIVGMRKEADSIILDTWNEIEESFRSYPSNYRKSACEHYGLVYFYRKGEVRQIA